MSRPLGADTLPHDAPELADGLSATRPPEHRGLRRDQVRLLVAEPAGLVHRRFFQLPAHLRPGDLLVVNNSATLAAALDGTSTEHGPLVVHVGTPPGDRPAPLQRVVELRTAPDAARPVLDGRPGEQIRVAGDVRFRLLDPYPRPGASPNGHGSRLWRAEVVGTDSVECHLARHGRPIAYGYLADRFPLEDFQTVFAVRPGSSEMPSAARPFSTDLVTRLIAEGIGIAPITLHTGLSSQDAGEPPQAEWFEVPAATARLVNATRRAGGRVIAVGTTAVRALESAVARGGLVRPMSGWTELVVGPDRPVRAVDGLVTGWHDPTASHLQLIDAVAGPALRRAAYAAARSEGYLWHEFGDAALFLPR